MRDIALITPPAAAHAALVFAVCVFAGCACACGAILWALLRTGLAWRLAIDAPNHRSLHTRPTPRIGGVGLTPVALGSTALLGLLPRPIIVAAAVLAVVSWLDDHASLPVATRFGVQVACAVAAAWAAQAMPPGTATPLDTAVAAVAIVALVWMTNLYNFMDGSDGLAGGMALVGFAALAAGAEAAGDAALAGAGAAVAGAAAGFLVFNWPPARIFLGDLGSIPTGFLAGAVGLLGWRRGDWPWWFAILVFSPFIADATLTLVARLARGEKVWQAHREHIYQRMVAHGYGHRGTALRWYALMIATAGTALALRDAGVVACSVTLGAWAALFLVAFVAGKRAWPIAGPARGSG
ncbi:MAG TPA: glycosyl transferase [Burkholderiaceae bacterium]|nr:glycosyl transferase [Burkholderiaceae bacterium]